MKRIEELGVAKPWTALKTASASHSTTTSWMFKSRAKRMPTSIALASISRAPRGPTVGLLRAAITFPLLSRIITPSPPFLWFANTAPLEFTLYCPGGGGTQRTSSGLTATGFYGPSLAIWNSSIKPREVFKVTLPGLPFPPVRITFLSFQIPQHIETNRSARPGCTSSS